MRNEPAGRLKLEIFDYIAEDLINCEGLDGVQYVLDGLLSKYDFSNYAIFERDRYSKNPDDISVLLSNEDLTTGHQKTIQSKPEKTNSDQPAVSDPPNHIIEHADQFMEYVKVTSSPMHCPFVWVPETSSKTNDEEKSPNEAESPAEVRFRAVAMQCSPDKLKDYFFFFYGAQRFTPHTELAEIGYLSHLTSDLLAAEHAQNLRKTLVLGNRERQCLTWTAQGKTSFEISKILGLSEHTVNNYIVSATRKLGASNRAHAIAKALRLELI